MCSTSSQFKEGNKLKIVRIFKAKVDRGCANPPVSYFAETDGGETLEICQPDPCSHLDDDDVDVTGALKTAATTNCEDVLRGMARILGCRLEI